MFVKKERNGGPEDFATNRLRGAHGLEGANKGADNCDCQVIAELMLRAVTAEDDRSGLQHQRHRLRQFELSCIVYD